MKISALLSADLPLIENPIKECINFGQWLLFKTNSDEKPQISNYFYLKVNEKIFRIGADGQILKDMTELHENVKIDELFYFSDLPRPPSQSNLSRAVAR